MKIRSTPTIMFGTKKGGAGKTTCSLVMCVTCATSGLKVGFRDCDPQGSLINAVHQSVFHGLNIALALPGTEHEFDVVIVDSPPELSYPIVQQEIKKCTCYILVTQTGILDLIVTAKSYETIMQLRPDLRVSLLVSQFDGRRRIDRALPEMLQEVGLADLPIIDPYMSEAELYRHIVYSKSGWTGTAREVKNRQTTERYKEESALISKAVLQFAMNGS